MNRLLDVVHETMLTPCLALSESGVIRERSTKGENNAYGVAHDEINGSTVLAMG